MEFFWKPWNPSGVALSYLKASLLDRFHAGRKATDSCRLQSFATRGLYEGMAAKKCLAAVTT